VTGPERRVILFFSFLMALWASTFVADTVRIVPWLRDSLPMCNKLVPTIMCWRRVE
jgi:hypothetical protein